ncbi:hypothetical protein B0H14DRAFT_3901109 [Mycena olivaceomarginata]|nr:hypothetical protein B0H14DRAFT_3901109 [Mycena olivaceomarginata]
MAHGLFHALLPFSAYEALTKGARRAGGCTCCKCAQRVPRILEFSLRPDILDPILKRGARRALVGLSALKGLAKRSTPANALAVLWAAEGALTGLNGMIDAWTEVVRPLIEAARAQVDAVMAGQTAEVLAEADFTSIISTYCVRFEDGERVKWAVLAIEASAKLHTVLASEEYVLPEPAWGEACVHNVKPPTPTHHPSSAPPSLVPPSKAETKKVKEKAIASAE